MASELNVREKAPRETGTLLKVIGLFIVTFLVVFILGWIYELFAENYLAQELETAPTASKPVLTVDPEIEKELAKVLEQDSIPSGVDLKDPFADRSNLANITRAGVTTLPIRESQSANGADGATAGVAGRPGAGQGAQTAKADTPKKINIAEETERRMRARDAQIRAGRNPGPVSAVFFIDDLLPVGVVSGGSKPPEVLMYSVTMQRTYSFPAGAVFSDGWLATWRPDGVAFGYAAENGAIYLRPWSTSLTSDSDTGRVVIGSAKGS